LVLGLIVASLFVAAGCGNSDGSEATVGAQAAHDQADRQAARQQAARQRARASARRRAAHRARVAARQQRRAEVRLQLREEREAEEAEAQEREAEEEVAPEESECDSNYAGACLSPTAYDYDCADGSGDGPEYTGTVTVVGEDHYGLDADGDGTGCELG
jgi:hypothetical protein